MYGLVNRAIRGLVEERFGEEAWEKISDRAGVSSERFVAMEAYDDAITYGLVGAASEELGLDAGTILEAFGEYWTLYTLEEGYGDMLAMMGSSLEEFLDNLDSMHDRIQEAMPALVPPSFEREDNEDGSSTLHYRSEREGLAPMVIGLLRGLAKRFETSIEVEHLPSEEKGHERFLIRESRD
ncbi:MAG: heme NO-binding domain-containing protein [Planctomycetota bacterium]